MTWQTRGVVVVHGADDVARTVVAGVVHSGLCWVPDVG
jgi:hypothetical protein